VQREWRQKKRTPFVYQEKNVCPAPWRRYAGWARSKKIRVEGQVERGRGKIIWKRRNEKSAEGTLKIPHGGDYASGA